MDINDSMTSELNDFHDSEGREIPGELPLMAVRDVVIFNYMIIPLFVGRPASVAAVNDAMSKDKLLMLVTQKDASLDEPQSEDMYQVGMV